MAAREPIPTAEEATPSAITWRVGLAVGGAIFAFGLYGLLHNATQTVPANVLKWIAGALPDGQARPDRVVGTSAL